MTQLFNNLTALAEGATDAPRVDYLSSQFDMVNLFLKNNVGSSGSQVDIDIDSLQVEEYALTGIDLTLDITGSGENGLDTGTEIEDGPSKWYYIWVIYEPSTSTVAGLFSLSETDPTMPDDYTKKRLIGAIFNGSGSNFISIFQVNKNVSRVETVIITGGAAAGYTLIDISAIIPVTAKSISGSFATLGSGQVFVAPVSTGRGQKRISHDTTITLPWSLGALFEPQTVYYKIVGTTTNIYISEWGY